MDLRARVQRLAADGGDLTAIRTALDRLLRMAVGHDVAAISTIDPATGLWTSCFVSGISAEGSAERERIIFDLEFRGADVNGYAELAAAPVPVGRLHDVTGGDLSRAVRWGQLLEPLGVSDEMRVMLRTGGACWGSLTLYRRVPSPPFSEREAAVVADVAAALADLFRLTLLRAALAAPAGIEQPPGLLLVGPDGAVASTSADAAAWLEAIDDRGRIPSAVRSVAAAARAGDGLARAALPARDGRWVVLHGSPMEGAGGSASAAPGAAGTTVAVIVEGARPAVLTDVIAGAYGLTPCEREVTALTARGRSTKQMAADLGISGFTVQDHLKAVFAKVGVQTRGELVAALHDRHYEPRREAGSTPGPYGWYLDDAM